MSLYENINRRRKLGISRSKADSTISKSSYSNMKKGFPEKAATGKIIKAKVGKAAKYSKLGSSLPKKTSMMEKAGKATAALYKKLPEEGLIAKAKRAAKKITSKTKNLFKAAPAAGTGKTLDKAKELAKYTGKIGKASKLAKASRLAKIARVATPVGLALIAGEAVLKTIPLTKERKAKVAKIKARIKKQNKGKSANQMADELASPSGRSTREIKKKAAGGIMKFNKGGFATNYYKGLI